MRSYLFIMMAAVSPVLGQVPVPDPVPGPVPVQEPVQVPLLEEATHFAASPALDEGKGKVLVTWASPAGAGGVDAAIFDSSGSLTRQVRVSDDRVAVSNWPFQDRTLACVATAAHHFVAWSMYNAEGLCALRVAVLNLDHEVLRVIEPVTAIVPWLQYRSLSLASVADGNVLLAYFSAGEWGQQAWGLVKVNNITPEGLVSGPGFIAANLDAHTRITSRTDGGAIVTWWSRQGPLHSNEVAFLNADGHVTSGPFEIESKGNGPASIVAADGDALVVFQQIYIDSILRVARIQPDGTGFNQIQELVNDHSMWTTRPLAISDGQNGAIIVVFKFFREALTYTGQVLGGFFHQDGSFTDLTPVTHFLVDPYNVELVPDGGGGAFVFLRDELNPDGIPTNSRPAKVYVRHFSSHGSTCFVSPRRFRRGEANSDGAIDISDPIALLIYLFLGHEEPACLDAGDVNDDGVLNVTDVIHLLNFMFQGGPPPRPPYDAYGIDETRGDPLGCSAPLISEVCLGVTRPPNAER